ncbi:site-specific integrase [Desulfosporosinus sp. OT]|uniref:tyrosine-type recombinase/integrase n=1 Tax=Desulfosporosinus sp. OT TaxID=913865 RepID=UPI0002239F8C|nr:site-specific integrase [Desulfosporosinus sp. OT]EGW40691.1 phage integrase family protein [Desulfosporosinus sp. OT]
MASIKKLDNGSYQATISLGRDENGKRINKYLTRPGLKECKAAARKIEQEHEEGKLTNTENIRVSEWIKSWLEIRKNKYSPSTYALYQGYLKNYYHPFFKQMKFKNLSDIHLKKFENELLAEQSTTSVRRILSCLRPIFHDALKDKSPFRDFKLPKAAKVDYSDVPTVETFQQILKTVKGTRDEPIILLAAWCGLRREEIFALRRNDLDFKNNQIRIDEAYVINDQNKYEIKSTKSENGLRNVAAPLYLMELIKGVIQNGFALRRKKKSKVVVEISDKKDKGELFIFPMRPDSYSSYIAKLVRKKNMPKTRLHFLRHFHATWLYENDVPDHLSAERLGHDIRVLKEVYQHLGVNKKEKINQKIIELQQEEIN